MMGIALCVVKQATEQKIAGSLEKAITRKAMGKAKAASSRSHREATSSKATVMDAANMGIGRAIVGILVLVEKGKGK